MKNNAERESQDYLILGLDLYNHSVTGEVSMTLCGVRPDCHKIPCVLIERKNDGVDRIHSRPPYPKDK